MVIATRNLALKLTLLSLLSPIAWSQRLPPNNCESVFRYERQGDSWIGHVTPPQNGLTALRWILRFSSRGEEQVGTVSNLAAYPDKETALQRMREGGRGSSFVHFDGYRNELPKIVRVELNGELLCSASGYEAPSKTSTRRHTLSITLTPSQGSFGSSTSVSSAPNSCGNVFRYERQNNYWIGIVMPPQDGITDISWTIRFSSRGVNNPGTVSYLEPYPNKETALQHMSDGGRGESFVRFDNYQDELPRIVHIELNGQVLCTANEFDPPSKTLTRQQEMSVSPSSTSAVQGPRPNTPRPITVNTQFDPTSEDCGVEGLVGLQYGGETVPRGRFPWLAALYHDSNASPDKVELNYRCVSTVISKRTVITAAHCIYGSLPDQLRVYVGRHDVNVHPEKDATLMFVEKVHTHPDFVGNLVPDSDVGLLVLTQQIQYSIYVRPICLWSTSTSLTIGDREQTTVAGWGINAEFKPTRFPMSVNVKPVSREECLREMITAKDFLTPRTICAGNSQGHGPCLGDSGGGLMVLRNNRWLVRGIVSLAQRAGNGCDLSNYVIYCDVASHLSWINQNVVR